MEELFDIPKITNVIKAQILTWLGHVVGASKNRQTQQVMKRRQHVDEKCRDQIKDGGTRLIAC